MWWLPTSDELTFFQKFKPDVLDQSIFPTKRQMLRVVMNIFDPLGMLDFIVIKDKMISQDLWRAGVTLANRRSYNQLHLIVDAIISAYAGLAFPRSSMGDEIHCCFVASKTTNPDGSHFRTSSS